MTEETKIENVEALETKAEQAEIQNAVEDSSNVEATKMEETKKETDKITDSIVVKKQSDETKLIILENGVPKPTTINELYRVSRALYSPEICPPWIKSEKQFFSVILFGAFKRLDPLTTLGCVASVKGRLSLYGDGPLSIAQASGSLESIEEWFFTKDGKKIELDPVSGGNPVHIELVYGAFCKVSRSGIKTPSIGTYTIGLAQKAKLYPAPKDDMPWNLHPHIMLKYRARAMALKPIMADVLAGMPIQEYDDREERLVNKEEQRLCKNVNDILDAKPIGNRKEPKDG
jgi:hypothetical protein